MKIYFPFTAAVLEPNFFLLSNAIRLSSNPNIQFYGCLEKCFFILLDAMYELSILLIMNLLWVDIQVQLNVLFHGILMLSM